MYRKVWAEIAYWMSQASCFVQSGLGRSAARLGSIRGHLSTTAKG